MEYNGSYCAYEVSAFVHSILPLIFFSTYLEKEVYLLLSDDSLDRMCLA